MIKEINILHSNDIHADFVSENGDVTISRLSNYIKEERSKNKDLLFCISGDVLCGSQIDKDFKGLSTIEIMNTIKPDVLALGNHEIDYGLGQALLLEKCANFPIICANFYLKAEHKRVFDSHILRKICGMNILIIGVITPEIANSVLMEYEKDSIVTVTDATEEIEKICQMYSGYDIDFTIVLSHLGLKNDIKMAEKLSKKSGVDIIIGGHTHTNMEEPVMVNNIPIVQIQGGSEYIGKLRINVDDEKNCISSYTWEAISTENYSEDNETKQCVMHFEKDVLEKSSRVVTSLEHSYVGTERNRESELYMLLSDALKNKFGLDVMLLSTGSVRSQKIGPVVTYGDLCTAFPFDDKLFAVYMSVGELKKILIHMLKCTQNGVHSEFYQLSCGMTVKYYEKENIMKVYFADNEANDELKIKVGIQEYHLINSSSCLGLNLDNNTRKLLADNCMTALEYALTGKQNSGASQKRIEIIK